MNGSASRRNRAAWFWAKHELIARWKAFVVLGLLAGVAGGISLAAVAGARRTDAAFPRYRAATGAPDAIVFGTQVGASAADYGPVERLPDVLDSGQFALAALLLKGYPQLGGLAPADSHLYRTVARPLLTSGRLPNPRRIDEVVVNRTAAAKFGLGVGDRVTIISSNDLNAFYGQAPVKGGPTIRARVVGVGDSTMDQLFGPDEPGFVPSGALLSRYGTKQSPAPEGRIAEATNLVVRLRPGADAAKFHRDVARVLHLTADQVDGKPVPGSQIPIRDLAEDDKRVEHATNLERIGLLLFAAAAALASLALVGQAIARAVYAMAVDAPTMRSIGMARPEVVRSLLIPHIATGFLGAGASIGSAALLSPLFPVGLAGRIDPDRGMHFDLVVLVPGAVAVALAVLVAASFAAWRASSKGDRTLLGRTSAIARVARMVLSLPIGLGAGLAVDRGRGPRSLPTRPAIVAAIAAVTGVVGCFGLLHGIDDALQAPMRSGQVWDATAYPQSDEEGAAVRKDVERDPNVLAAGIMERLSMVVRGTEIPVYAVTPMRGRRPFAVIAGRAPRTASDVAVAPASARALGLHVGDRVRIRAGTNAPVTMTVTGITLLPQTPHSSFDQGAALTPAGLTRAANAEAPARYETNEEVTVVASYRDQIGRSVRALHQRTNVEVEGTTTPQDVLNLRNVRPLPRALAGFLVMLGIAALGHALVTAVRRRRHELAILRALGFTPRQTAVTIVAQAGTVALVGLVVGIPLGILLGRQSWQWVADATPLVFAPPVAVTVILLAIPITIVVSNVLAAGPARHAARTRPAEVLRTE